VGNAFGRFPRRFLAVFSMAPFSASYAFLSSPDGFSVTTFSHPQHDRSHGSDDCTHNGRGYNGSQCSITLSWLRCGAGSSARCSRSPSRSGTPARSPWHAAEKQIAQVQAREAQELSRLDKLIAAAKEFAHEVKDRTVAFAKDIKERAGSLFGKEPQEEQAKAGKEQEQARPPTPEMQARLDELLGGFHRRMEAQQSVDARLSDFGNRMDAKQQEQAQALARQQQEQALKQGQEQTKSKEPEVAQEHSHGFGLGIGR